MRTFARWEKRGRAGEGLTFRTVIKVYLLGVPGTVADYVQRDWYTAPQNSKRSGSAKRNLRLRPQNEGPQDARLSRSFSFKAMNFRRRKAYLITDLPTMSSSSSTSSAGVQIRGQQEVLAGSSRYAWIRV